MKNNGDNSLVNEVTFVVLVIVLSALFFLATNVPNHDRNSALYQKEADLYNTVIRLEREQRELEQMIKALKDDPLFVEYKMRDKFKMKRPKEIIITKGNR